MIDRQPSQINCKGLCISFGQAYKNTCKGIFLRLHQLAHHAKVNECYLTVRFDKDIARVWIGMKYTNLKNLLQINAESLFGNFLRPDAP